MSTYLSDFYFVLILFQLAVGFSIAYFFLKGLWWLCVVAGLSWILLGIGSVIRTEIFYYQRTLAIVFIVIGIGMFFMPAWFRRQGQKTMSESMDDDDFSEKESSEQYEKRLKSGRRKRIL